MAPLEGIRILDVSRVLAGPYCTALLADMGADVVKVEPPTGDDSRHLGPFLDGESVYFGMLNRGKRSIALDLKDDADLATFLDLAACADVVIENFRPGVADRLGIGPTTLLERHPGLVYASISGFGQEGPQTRRPAYDLIIQAMSGLMAATGEPDGGPTKIGESVADVTAGLFAATAVCAALVDRERSGRGRHLDVSMLDSMLALQPTNMSLLAAHGTPPARVGNRHPVTTPFGVFRAADGPVVLAVANDRTFAGLLALIGRPGLADHPSFRDDAARTAHEPQVRAVVEEWTGTRTVAEVVAEAGAHGVPAGPVQDIAQAVQTASGRGVVGRMTHAGRDVACLRQPVRFVGDAEPVTMSVPGLGTDRDAVLADWRRSDAAR